MRVVIDRLPSVPDDRGASCPDIPDAISFRDVARERACDRRRPLSEQAAFDDLLQAFWKGEFEHIAQPAGELQSLVFTLETPSEISPDFGQLYSVTSDGHVLKQVADETIGHERYVATLERQALFWTRQELLLFIARFWDESPSTRLAVFGTLEEAFEFMAACSAEEYPAVPRSLLERLHISRAVLKKAERKVFPRHGASKSRTHKGARLRPRQGAPEKPVWKWIYPQVLRWLDEEGEPDTRAEVERYIMGLLAERDEHVARSTLQRHASVCIARNRESRGAYNGDD
jgi:hypothetical protein